MRYLSVKEIAAIWAVSERSVRNYCAKGRVPGAFLIGKTWSIPADAQKPNRSNARVSRESPLLRTLRQEKTAALRGGIYHKTQVDLTYNSNHIEGSRLTLDQTRFIFETSTINMAGESVGLDDIIETVNHFRCIDYVIDHAEDPLSEHLLKELHQILKSSTSDSQKDWFAVGDYKRLPNEVGGVATSSPENVSRDLRSALRRYNNQDAVSLEDVAAFHVAFERIHPFQDGNGRVGRLVMFKECLKNGIIPFVITDEMKLYYYRGLSRWDSEHVYLIDTCRAAQDTFKAELDYFRIPYVG
ncbi:MAG: Fic family protein [Atopobiaceae bacterium]|jgi:Fic family protein|nr:Fic family protein [Atopobiaceae bacterium]